MINLRNVRQSFDFDCGAAALQVVMEYYGVEMRLDEIMAELDTDDDGTNYTHMTALAEKKGFSVFASEGISIEQLKNYIDEGYPVIVLVQAWSERYMTLDDWRADYDDGHYAVVIGYKDNIIVFEDPASPRHTWLAEEEFLARWHDMNPYTNKKIENFAMVLKGKKPAAKVLVVWDNF
jgi:predicted double-glycine peptidase